jgi:hypothetical protein
MRQARHSIIDLIEIEPDVWASEARKKQQQDESVDVLGLKLIPWLLLYYMFYRLFAAFMGWQALPSIPFLN